MAVVKGEGPFADAVRRALKHAQSRGIDLSGVEVEVVPDPSITDFGAYTEHHGGLRFRIRYHPRYAADVVLAAHEAGHVAYWTWQSRRFGRVQYVPDVDEPLAEAFGAVTARKLFNVPVTFKGAPPNLTRILPERTTYITATVDGKPTVVKVPEWGDYRSRYRAGAFLAPYFYNVTNWAHVFGNFTAAPADVIKTVHEAWRGGAVEVVPGWGPVWRREPTWRWPDASADKTPQRSQDSAPPVGIPTPPTVQKGDAVANSGAAPPQTDDVQKAVVQAQPSADVPLPPSGVQPPRYFSTDIAPGVKVPEWDRYISGRRVLVVFRNWPHFDRETLKDVRRDSVVGVGVVSEGRLRFERRIPAPRVVDPNAWIELVDEKTGKVLARLRSDELYKLTNEGAPVTLYWSHVAAEEKWPGWGRFVERARELEEKLGAWRLSGTVAPPPGSQQTVVVNPDSTVSTVRVANVPTEYTPPKVPDDVRRQFENLLFDLKKLGENVNLKNVGETHDKFIQLRDKALDIARAYPELIDEANVAVGRAGSAIREVSDKLYQALARAAGRDSFWRGEGDVKTPIGVYKYDPATGAFLLSLYDKPTAENVVGFIRDDGTPVVVKKTQNLSEAEEEYSRLLQNPQTAGGFTPPPTPAVQNQPPATQSNQQVDFLQPFRNVADFLATNVLRNVHKTRGPPASDVRAQLSVTQPGQQTDFLQPLRGVAEFLTNAVKTGAGIKLTVLGGTKPSPAGDSEFVQPSSEQQFVVPQSKRRAVYNRRRGMPKLDSSPDSGDDEFMRQEAEEFVVVKPPGDSDKREMDVVRPPDYVLIEAEPSRQTGGPEFIQPPGGQQRQDEFVAVKPSRPLDYVLVEEETRRTASAVAQDASQSYSGFRPAGYAASQQSGGAPAQLAETSQARETSQKRYKGRPVAVAI